MIFVLLAKNGVYFNLLSPDIASNGPRPLMLVLARPTDKIVTSWKASVTSDTIYLATRQLIASVDHPLYYPPGLDISDSDNSYKCSSP